MLFNNPKKNNVIEENQVDNNSPDFVVVKD